MSVRVMLVVMVALFVQVYSSRDVSDRISVHSRSVKQQLKTMINPSGMLVDQSVSLRYHLTSCTISMYFRPDPHGAQP